MRYALIFGLLLSLIWLFVSCNRPSPQIPAANITPMPKLGQIDLTPGQKETSVQIPNKASWEQEWDNLVKEAKKEQWLVILSASSGETRSALTKAMRDKFDIKVDWLTATTPQIQAKVLAENRAGLRTADVLIGGATVGFALKPYGIIDPLDKTILVPEVMDASKWYQGQFPWWDKEHMIIAPLVNVSPIVAINTQMAEEKEIMSFRDLLNPKWKGKISMTSPLTGGTGLASFGMVGEYIMGWDYIKELAKQEPVIITDTRLGVEWLARGKQAISWAARSESMIEFQRAGAPIKYLKMNEGTYATDAGTAFVKLKDSPHRAASTIFINWLLTQEGQTVFSEARGFESNRIDVSKDHVDPIRARSPGVKYFSQDEKTRSMEDSWKLKAKEILAL